VISATLPESSWLFELGMFGSFVTCDLL